MAYGTRQGDGTVSFGSRHSLDFAGEPFDAFRTCVVPGAETLPYSLRILLENLLRQILFHPARVLMQDYSGVPCLVDLAALRDEEYFRHGGAIPFALRALLSGRQGQR